VSDSENFFENWDTPAPRPEPTRKGELSKPESVPPELISPTSLSTSKKKRLSMAQIDTGFDLVSDQQKEILQAALVDSVIFGADVAALTCKGSECPLVKKCPLTRAKVPYPLDSPCPWELAMIKTWVGAYMEEMEIDPMDPMTVYDASVAGQMATLRLLKHRAEAAMAEDPRLEKVFELATEKQATVVVTGNHNADYLLKSIELSRKVAQEAVMSRKSKAAALKGGFKDRSKQAAELHDRIRKQKQIAEKRVETELDENGVPKKLTEITRFEREE